ncbi:MAG: hypothetical protein FWG25_08095, partial [Promicromonosporaceae bacterium]|nr:hypothetical protein [Promicromonosporaceae bacterium]
MRRKTWPLRAAVALAGALALMMGAAQGQVTHALWTESVEVSGDIAAEIAAGTWSARIQMNSAKIKWYDSSRDALTYNWTWYTNLHQMWVGSLGFMKLADKPNTWRGTWTSTGLDAATFDV